MDFFTPAQIVGYVAFILGITSFLQKSDRRLIFFNASQCVAYTVHFFLLGNATASGSAFVSAIRSIIALHHSQRWIGLVFIGINIVIGLTAAKTPAGWLPVIGCCLGTYAMFYMTGIGLRVFFLCSTVMWIANNILSGSIGGTALESCIFLTNGTTIVRMLLRRRKNADDAAADKILG